MSYILGLDLGPTSIGWAAVEVDEKHNTIGFAKIRDTDHLMTAVGSRIFQAGVDNLNQGQREEPKNKKRREKRSVRRRLRRARARRLKLIRLLEEHGLIDKDKIEEIQSKDPYEIRARALEGKIGLDEFGRILLHFAKRRGFKSNRRQPEDDKEKGELQKGRERLAKELDGRTLGQFWHEKLEENKSEAIRNKLGEYKWIAQREQYIDELARIWQKQAEFYTDKLTKDLYDELKDILFEQIPFELSNRKKRKVIGTCSLIEGKPRCGWSERIAQRFRILQKVNDIVITIDGEERPLNRDERDNLTEALSIKKDLKFEQIRKQVWKNKVKPDWINFEYKPTAKLTGNSIDAMLSGGSFFEKKKWTGFSEEQKDEIWGLLRDFLKYENISSEEVEREIKERFGLEFKKSDWQDKLIEPKGNCNFSIKALEQIVPKLETGMSLYDAIAECGFGRKHKHMVILPLPTRENGFQLTNPVVRSVLFEARKVVNLLIKELGLPERIVIETARELKGSKDRRQEILKGQIENEKDRERIKQEIRELRGWGEEVEISGMDVLKYRLWEEQDHYCPYSCNKIPVASLFSRDTEIDHILPYSMSLDNTMRNKVVCFSSENHNKLQNTPISWLGEGSSRWQKIEEAMSRNSFNFSDEKWERFSVLNEEIAEKYQPERLLRDTSYIAREVRDYLKRLYPNAQEAEKRVGTTKGPITAELRNLWNLNAILRDGEIGPKKRDDLRHHAIDAAVVAITSVGMIQHITKVLQANWPRRPKRAGIAEPWEGFGEELASAIEGMKVSHRVQRKVRGALHKETNYWKENKGVLKGKYITRKALSGLTTAMVENICDERIKELVKGRLYESGGNSKKAFEKPLCLPNKNGEPIPIWKVRVWRTAGNMIQLKDNIWVEPGSNHHVEIFELPDGKREGRVISMFEAAQRVKKSESNICRDYGDDKKFVCSLSINEMFMMETEDGNHQLHRVQKMDKNKNIILRPQLYGGLMKETDKPPLIQRKSPNTLRGYKVTVDPLGRVRRAND